MMSKYVQRIAKRCKVNQIPLRHAAVTPDFSESFINGTNANYVEALYNEWLNGGKVHSSWAAYFQNVEKDLDVGSRFVAPEKLVGTSVQLPDLTIEHYQLAHKIVNFRNRYHGMGHFQADLDPLKIKEPITLPSLAPEAYDLTEADMNTDIRFMNRLGIRSPLLQGDKPFTVKDMIDSLKFIYSSKVAVEFTHIKSSTGMDFISDTFEGDFMAGKLFRQGPEDMKESLQRIAWATLFEEFVHKKWADKRFGCDGAEVIIPGLLTMVDKAAETGVKELCIGMAHRGRLNVLHNVLEKPLVSIFHEFMAGTATKDEDGSGDVKYHLGTSCDHTAKQGELIHLSLLANPSHLEAVNPVVEGVVAAKQKLRGDRKEVMSVLVHGDASIAGQGVVYESITMSHIPKYTTGGTMHVVLNNQIGFTTDPEDSRPGTYCTDVAKAVGAPIFHVNGDDVDAVCWVFKLAVLYRQKFAADVVVDICAYRKYGHNEIDQPAFTQPQMYNKIIPDQIKSLVKYKEKLISAGIITEEEYETISKNIFDECEQNFVAAKTYQSVPSDWRHPYTETQVSLSTNNSTHTAISEALFDKIGAGITKILDEPNFAIHPTIKKMMEARRKALTSGKDIDWATAEALAYAALMEEGFNVRLSGQDVERGTFSHRHAIIHDQVNDKTYDTLSHIGAKGSFSVTNSFLSEYAVLGYDMGYAIESPNTLVMWEAQFGDFVNGAQIIIDQFLSSGKQKWFIECGLVLLLPHGQEGMGPEHSSARLERFLINSDSDPAKLDMSDEEALQQVNWQIVNCTTPANYFHVLRRQLHRNYRTPLIVMSPKSLLRSVKSNKTDFLESSEGFSNKFVPTIGEIDPAVVPANVTKVIFCNGKIYYDLLKNREEQGIHNVAIIRVEQLSPFPGHHVRAEIEKYPKNAQVVWCQEEAKNQGAWQYVYFFFEAILNKLKDKRELEYCGRSYSASPATGSVYRFRTEQANLVKSAFE
jgi:2-oxoglutarate dehydrogenase E1 component